MPESCMMGTWLGVVASECDTVSVMCLGWTLRAHGGTRPVVRSLDLETGMECVLLGTLYKDMCLKPSILDEYSKEVCLQNPSRAIPQHGSAVQSERLVRR
jgi:hypothetical protein